MSSSIISSMHSSPISSSSSFAVRLADAPAAEQHFSSFATRLGDSAAADPAAGEKLVRALGPHISRAASSYARAASSAVSNVPSQIRVFLDRSLQYRVANF